jgi:dipeptidyl aminopeptidase/acylaminoacyl peptidase
MSMPFDIKTQTFGQPQMEFNCVSINKSVSVPRVSPDGRYVLFTLGDYGQFHIWHKSSDLWIKDLQTGIIRPLTQANSKDVDSYHTWSSNGRWIVFSSRRDDGSYTRLYIAYFDNKGIAHKAFLLPQADPEENLLRLKSYNVPELTKDNVKISPAQFKACIFGDANNAEYQPTR